MDVLYVYREYEYQIDLGPYVYDLPSITWRKFITEVHGQPNPTKLSDFRDIYYEWGIQPRELDTECDHDLWIDTWARTDSPNARAHHLLQELDIGPELRGGPGEIGGIEFIDGPCIGNDYLGVRAEDGLSVSLLQHRLNALGQRIEVVLTDCP